MYSKDKWVADTTTPEARKIILDWIKLTQGDDYKNLEEGRWDRNHKLFHWPNGCPGTAYRKGNHLNDRLKEGFSAEHIIPTNLLKDFLSGSQNIIHTIFN